MVLGDIVGKGKEICGIGNRLKKRNVTSGIWNLWGKNIRYWTPGVEIGHFHREKSEISLIELHNTYWTPVVEIGHFHREKK